MGVFIQKKFEKENLIIELDCFEKTCYVSVTNKNKLELKEASVILCKKFYDRYDAEITFLNLILRENRIKINVTIR